MTPSTRAIAGLALALLTHSATAQISVYPDPGISSSTIVTTFPPIPAGNSVSTELEGSGWNGPVSDSRMMMAAHAWTVTFVPLEEHGMRVRGYARPSATARVLVRDDRNSARASAKASGLVTVGSDSDHQEAIAGVHCTGTNYAGNPLTDPFEIPLQHYLVTTVVDQEHEKRENETASAASTESNSAFAMAACFGSSAIEVAQGNWSSASTWFSADVSISIYADDL